MKIRTLTLFYNFEKVRIDRKFLYTIKNFILLSEFLREKIDIQTLRLSTNIFNLNTNFKAELSFLEEILQLTKEKKIEFFNAGTVENLPLHSVIQTYQRFDISSSLKIRTDRYDKLLIKKGAKIIKELSRIDPLKNFNFGISFNLSESSPFYPSSFSNLDGFSIGYENGDILQKIFSKIDDLDKAERILSKELLRIYLPLEKLYKYLSLKTKLNYIGMDLSFAPGIEKKSSVFESFLILKKNIKRKNLNDITIAGMITESLKKINLKRVGYCGLMLPISEDFTLAKMSFEKKLRIRDILFLSSVCGCGLDTLPLPFEVKDEFLESLILDSFTISKKWKKPLQVRVLPVKDKNSIVDFNLKYLLKSKFLDY